MNRQAHQYQCNGDVVGRQGIIRMRTTISWPIHSPLKCHPVLYIFNSCPLVHSVVHECNDGQGPHASVVNNTLLHPHNYYIIVLSAGLLPCYYYHNSRVIVSFEGEF